MELTVALWGQAVCFTAATSGSLFGSGRDMARRERGETRLGSALILVRVSAATRGARRLRVKRGGKEGLPRAGSGLNGLPVSLLDYVERDLAFPSCTD